MTDLARRLAAGRFALEQAETRWADLPKTASLGQRETAARAVRLARQRLNLLEAIAEATADET